MLANCCRCVHGGELRERIVAASAAMQLAVRWAGRIATSDVPVLIRGETGTGKELLAREIHRSSGRGNFQFVAVNCGAIPAGLIEAELFGYRKGAFTSAAIDKPGLAEEAHRGSLFLDEIGELPLQMQAALLRFLECGELRRLGENRPRRVDARIICATNRALTTDVGEGRFRPDLYFRLAVATYTLPPLRERPDDIEHIARDWVAVRGSKWGLSDISDGALKVLQSLQWPGNVRELRNVLERSALIAEGHSIREEHVLESVDDVVGTHGNAVLEHLEERSRVVKLLERNDWKIAQTAADLGISRVTLWRRMRRFNLTRSS